jgi:hypothetical protein
MKTARNFLLILLAIFSLTNKSCFGQWSTSSITNNLIRTYTETDDEECIVTDGSGGAIIVFRNTGFLCAQRISKCGVKLWSASGVIICNATNAPNNPAIVSDGNGGAIIAWEDMRSGNNQDIYAQRIDQLGAVQWTTNGIALCNQTNNQLYPSIISDSANGAIITWEDYRNGGVNSDIYARRINGSGVAQGTANGVAICIATNDQVKPLMVSDGSGGAIITWRDFRNETTGDIYSRRFNSSNIAQGTGNGVAICTAANIQETPTLTADGSGGAIIGWSDLRGGILGPAGNTGYKIYIQRINASGVVQWSANGLPICTLESDMMLPVINSDGSGGAIISWQDYRANASGVFMQDIYAQRVSSSGSVQWTTNGIPVCTAISNQSSPSIITSSNGNSIITWEDKRNGLKDIYAQGIDANGIALWTLDGVAVCTAPNDQNYPAIISDGNEGAILTWGDNRGNGTAITFYSSYTQRVNANGLLGTGPALPTISGPTTICAGSTNTYSVPNVAGIQYSWSKPSGWSGSSYTNSFTTTANTSGGNLVLTGNINCSGGNSSTTLVITVVSAVPSTPGTISGSSSICSGTSSTYSVPAVTGATSYTWTLPNGWTGTSATNSITITAGTSSGNISVTANNSCGPSVAKIKAITVNSIPDIPSTISGQNSICEGTFNAYSVPSISGATSYTWTLPNGWTGTSTTNSINANSWVTSGNITVMANNSCGSSPAQILAVTVNTIPATPALISGVGNICLNTSNTYSVVDVTGATSYSWTLPNGWTGSSTTNSIPTIANGNSGNITVTANNGCGSSPAQTFSVNVSTIPGLTTSISGTNSICAGSSNTFNVPSVNGAISYTWILPNGWTGNSTTNSITTTANGTGGEITVTANNSCGSSTPQTLSVTTNPSPIINTQPTNTQVSIGNQAIFTTSANGGTYQWQVNSGSGFQNVTNGGQFSGATTNTLTVSNTSMSNNTNQYQCIVTSNNCSATSNAATLTVINNAGIDEANLLNNFEIYPNPTSNFVTVKFNNNLLGSNYQIVDNTGRIVLSGMLLNENQIIELNTLSAGIYSFSVLGELSKTLKLVKN